MAEVVALIAQAPTPCTLRARRVKRRLDCPYERSLSTEQDFTTRSRNVRHYPVPSHDTPEPRSSAVVSDLNPAAGLIPTSARDPQRGVQIALIETPPRGRDEDREEQKIEIEMIHTARWWCCTNLGDTGMPRLDLLLRSDGTGQRPTRSPLVADTVLEGARREAERRACHHGGTRGSRHALYRILPPSCMASEDQVTTRLTRNTAVHDGRKGEFFNSRVARYFTLDRCDSSSVHLSPS